MSVNIEHDFLKDTPVRVVFGKEIPGFLLDRRGGTLSPRYYALYPDGTEEEIVPPEGFPRPDPDNAVRTKRVVIPQSYRDGEPLLFKQGSRYTGQMRRVVQCLNSRGLESKFSYLASKTHGVLEYPVPRMIGSTGGDEKALAAQRRYWLIEISSQGVYAAPFTFGTECVTCGKDLSAYQPTSEQIKNNPGWDAFVAEISLHWAFHNRNESGEVQQLMDASQIAPAYNQGTAWYPGMGWAFSWSGTKAANVVAKGVGTTYFETRLMTLSFGVSLAGDPVAFSIESLNGVATVVLPGHGFSNGDIAVVSGALQEPYNGAHVVKEATSLSFKFNIFQSAEAGEIESPATPAEGQVIRIANLKAKATLSAALTVGSAGRVTFRDRDRGTLWVPSSEGIFKWDGIAPLQNIINVSGPVHVFYDGEQQIVTNWSSSTTTVPLDQKLSPHPPPPPVGPIPTTHNPDDFWAGVQFGYHIWNSSFEYVDVVQDFNGGWSPCKVKVWNVESGGGHSYSPYTDISWGFSGPFDLMTNGYSRRRIETSTTVEGEFREPQFDWAHNSRYTTCGSNEFNCAVSVYYKVWSRYTSKTTVDRSETGSGTSALFLFPTDREAVGGIRAFRQSASIRTSTIKGYWRGTKWEIQGQNATCAFTSYDHRNGLGSFMNDFGGTSQSTSDSSYSLSFSFRASGGISRSENVISNDAQLEPFIIYLNNVKETAESSIFFMRGGLEYPDANLIPSNQIKNSVLRRSDMIMMGGIKKPTFPLAFIGQI